jgi:uncharacterized FlaG/YvyC family protein
MEISSIHPGVYSGAEANSVSPQEAAQRRELIQAANTVNASGVFGEQNELVFVLNPGTRQMIVRLVDRKTGEVKRQVPPEYVLRLATDLRQKT